MLMRLLLLMAAVLLTVPVLPGLGCGNRQDCPHCLRKQAEPGCAVQKTERKESAAPAAHSCCESARENSRAAAEPGEQANLPLLPANDPANEAGCPCALSGSNPVQRPENAQQMASLSVQPLPVAAAGQEQGAILATTPRFVQTAVLYPPGAHRAISSTVLRI